jgi:hypothetical protein
MMRNWSIMWGVLIFLALPTSPGQCAEPPLVAAADGSIFGAELRSIDPNGQVVFETAGRKRQMPLGDLVAWGACRELRRTPVLALADGGLVVADIQASDKQSDKESVLAESQVFGRLELHIDALAGVVFVLPSALKDRDALVDRIVKEAGQSDRLLLDNGDQLTGIVERIGGEGVRISTNAGAVDMEMGRVAAIVFNPALRGKVPSESARTWLGFSDGSRLAATGVRLDSSALRFVAAGRTWTTAPRHLVFIQPLSGRAVYLSDLKPSDYKFTPFLDATWPYRLDRSVAGTWLRAGGAPYLKGIGMHSAARLTYDLDEPYKRFQAELAMDDSASGGGSARYSVFVDGKERFASETIRGGMKPAPISVDLSGAKRLELVVDYADRGDVLDHADWLNARLIK